MSAILGFLRVCHIFQSAIKAKLIELGAYVGKYCQSLCFRVFFIWAASWQNQRNGMVAQRRLGSAWASAESNHSLHCSHEESLGTMLPIEQTAKTQISLGIWVLAASTVILLVCHEAAQFYHNYIIHVPKQRVFGSLRPGKTQICLLGSWIFGYRK